MCREMKKTGIDWCPEIPADWYIDKVKNNFYISKEKAGDKNPTVLKLARSGIQVRDISNNEGQLAESYENYNPVKYGDLLLNPMDLYSGANCNMSEIEGVISPAYVNLRAKKDLNPKFFDYYFKVQYWTMAMFAHGKGVSFDNRWTINSEGIKNYKIPYPAKLEQDLIVNAILKEIRKVNGLIYNQECQIERLKAYKQSLITEVVTKGLNPDAKMKDSGVEWIGKIPRHWNYLKAFYAYDKIGDIDHYMPESIVEGYPYVMTGDLKQVVSEIDFDNCKQVSEEDYKQLSKKIIANKGDIIFARYATIGTVCYVDIEKEFLVSYSCVTIKPKHNIVDGKYLWYYYQSLAFLEDVKKLVNANTQANVGMESLYRANLVIPPCNEQEDIITFLDQKCAQIDNLISIKQSKIEKLNEYKKSLIYEYVTGKKQVI